MKKGFIFTADALGAIAIILLAGVAWTMAVYFETGTGFEQAHKTAQDNALYSLYTGTEESQLPDLEKANAVCKKYYSYDETAAGTGEILEFQHCKGARP